MWQIINANINGGIKNNKENCQLFKRADDWNCHFVN